MVLTLLGLLFVEVQINVQKLTNPVILFFGNMNIPEDQLESTKRMLRYIVDERTSAQ